MTHHNFHKNRLNFLARAQSFIMKEQMDPLEQAQQQMLVVRCQVGDRLAMEELFLRHHRALSYYLGRMLERDDVADVQQEVWLSVIRKIRQLRNPEAFVVWLYQIAHRKALSRLGGTRLMTSLEDTNGQVVAVVDDEQEFSFDDAARIHEELGKLSPPHREVLLLRFIEDLSYEQIADIIECNPGTVRSRLHYAKLALRQRLEKKT